jgi:hypothetical protein
MRHSVAVAELHEHSARVTQHGTYICYAPMRKGTYVRAARAAEFLYNQLKEDKEVESWTYIPQPWISQRPFPDDLTLEEVTSLIRNCYIAMPNLLAAAQARNIHLIRIGSHRKSRANTEVGKWRHSAELGIQWGTQKLGGGGTVQRGQEKRRLLETNARHQPLPPSTPPTQLEISCATLMHCVRGICFAVQQKLVPGWFFYTLKNIMCLKL